MSQFNYTKKPNFLSDGKNIRNKSLASAEVHPSVMGWVGPGAGKSSKKITGLSFASSGANTVSAATCTNYKVTATSTAHGFTPGARVTIAGITPTAYNGKVTIVDVTANTFTYDVAVASLAALSVAGTATGGVVTATCVGHGLIAGQYVLITNSVANTVAEGFNGYVNIITVADANTFTYNTVYVPTSPGTLGKAITAASWVGGIATITATAHGISPSITANVVISGILTNTNYNVAGGVQVKVVDANTLTYPLADPGVTGATFNASSLVTSYGESYKNVEVIVACGVLKAIYDDAMVVPTYTAAMTPIAGTLDVSVGDAIVVTVTPIEDVIVQGAPYVVLTLSGGLVGTRNAVYDPVSSTPTSLVFKYFVATADIAAGITVTPAAATTGGYVGDILPTRKNQKSIVTFSAPAAIAYTVQA